MKEAKMEVVAKKWNKQHNFQMKERKGGGGVDYASCTNPWPWDKNVPKIKT
jgi:hypothetical protein